METDVVILTKLVLNHDLTTAASEVNCCLIKRSRETRFLALLIFTNQIGFLSANTLAVKGG